MKTERKHGRNRTGIDREILRIEALFLRDDDVRPRLFTGKDRGALRQIISSIVECDTVYRRHGMKLVREEGRDAAERVCDAVRATMDEYARLKVWITAIPGVERTRPRRVGAAASVFREHIRLVKRMGKNRVVPEERLSLLLRLIQLDILMLGHLW